MRVRILLPIAAAWAVAAGAASQAAAGGTGAGNPSTAQIISALRPNAAALGDQTRGIRAIAPGSPAAAAPSLDLNIQFQTGSAVLSSEATQELDNLGSALTSSALAADQFRIEGHTDTVGTPAANQSLSQQRADAVAAYLESKFGIIAGRLRSVGVGEADLLVPTPDQTPQAQNRRVHIVNLGA